MQNSEREMRLERLKGKGWIAVDLDGTLAHYDIWRAWNIIGPPIPAMVERVKAWLEDGHDVRIFTARVGGFHHPTFVGNGDGLQLCRVDNITFTRDMMEKVISDWCLVNIGRRLKITCEKDVEMIEIWDDRAIPVEKNTGRILLATSEDEAELSALKGAP